MTTDGVIKFTCEHTHKPLYAAFSFLSPWHELTHWRDLLFATDLIGQDPQRYDGKGYGNLSARVAPPGTPLHQRAFYITGTQTSGLEKITTEHYAYVKTYSPEKNQVMSEGDVKPSAESMTHGIVYDLDDSLTFVFHSHSPHIWKAREALEIPTTSPDVDYGTPAMCKEVARLFAETDVRAKNIFAMAGHPDGIVTFGKTAEEAGLTMLTYLGRSLRV